MATKTTLIDDMDGIDGAEQRRFSVGGPEFEIDLIEKNWERLCRLIDEIGSFVEKARIVKPRSLYSTLSPSAKQEIRKALKKSGRQRVSDAEVQAWQSKHPAAEPAPEPDCLPKDDA